MKLGPQARFRQRALFDSVSNMARGLALFGNQLAQAQVARVK